MNEPKKPLAAYFAAGFPLSILGMFVAVVAAGGGHGTYIPATVFFPYAMGIADLHEQIGVIPILMALLQFPIYGLALGSFNKKVVLILLLLTHSAAAFWIIKHSVHF